MDYIDYDLVIEKDLTINASFNNIIATDKMNIPDTFSLELKRFQSNFSEKSSIERIGDIISTFLFPSNIKEHFYKAQQQSEERGIRIKLKINNASLANYPWESLHLDDTFIATSKKFILIRVIASLKLKHKNFEKRPIKILFVVSNPRDTTQLEFEEEFQVIQSSISDRSSQITLERIYNPTPQQLSELIDSDKFDILHFAGHGGFENDKGFLVFTGNDRKTVNIDYKNFTNILQNHRSLKLVILNTAESAKVSSSNIYEGFAPSLIKAGVPSVIGIQFPITDLTAINFSKYFYKMLGKVPEDEQIQFVRHQLLLDYESQPHDFISYALYSADKVTTAETTAETTSETSENFDQFEEEKTNLEVPIHSDTPTQIDLLNRKIFAEALSKRLNDLWILNKKEGAFIINIDGPWGSGKTSLLKLLESELEIPKTKKWVVINFNAWQHHKSEKPWWLLMDTIYKEIPSKLWNYGFKKRAIRIRIIDIGWRLLTGKWSRILLIAALILFFTGIGLFLFIGDSNNSTEIAKSSAGNISSTELNNSSDDGINDPFYKFLDKYVVAIITLISSLITGVYGIKNSLFPGSETDVKNVLQSIDDPTEKLKKQFGKIVEKTKQPIIVFIDDLDRCKEEYVVDFLEGLQTLFKDKNIFFVIAADKRWLYSSYEKIYNSFNDLISEPGRPLRYLFLDKVFQLTFSIPVIDPELQKIFWNHLLTKKQNQDLKTSLENATIKAKEEFTGKHTEDEIIKTVRNKVKDPSKTEIENIIENVAFRGAAVLQLSESKASEDIEHKLHPFAPLIDPNPRFMKKVVNTYGLFRSIELIRNGGKTRFEKLALWVILSLRWPILAEYLEKNPEKISSLGKDSKDIDDIPDNLRSLFKDKRVEDVVNCNIKTIKPISLDEDTIRDLTGKQ